ncbi:MAG TPA: CHAD domain-containing protein [Candidatus Krumholzibacteria bacterium]|nr:CHAD domain-containing protein [Candidatus Krumholzibacteria bacterium]
MRDWAKRLKTFESLAAYDADALSDDDVHDLRVTTRRLRASLWVLRHCTESSVAERSHRELRAIGKVLGERRMWDIAKRDAETYRAPTGAIEKKQKRAHARLRRALRRPRVRKLLKDLRKLEKTIPHLRLERLVPWLQGYEWELAYRMHRRPTVPTERHELRILGKKVRYVLECLGRNAARLEALQDHLGREHDLVVLHGMIGARRGVARDRRAAVLRANRVMTPALRSGMRELRALQNDLARWR